MKRTLFHSCFDAVAQGVLNCGLLAACGLLFSVIPISAQQVTVSGEINIRNDYSYHILGQVNDAILLYQDKGKEKKLLLFDETLQMQSERVLRFPDERPIVYDLVNMDTAFAVFYGFREEQDNVTRMAVYSDKAELVDSVEMSRFERQWKGLDFEVIFSEDRSKVALYNIMSDENMKLVVFDVRSKKTLIAQDYIIRNGNLYENFREVALSNSGQFYLLSERNNTRSNKDKHEASIFHFLLSGSSANEIVLPLHGVVSSDIQLAINNRTGTVALVGLYHEKRISESQGYFFIESTPNAFDNVSIELIPFEDVVFFEVYGEKDRDHLENFTVTDVHWKANGAPILIFEMQTDLSRRSSGNSYYSGGNYFGAYDGWSDHYREDLIVVSLDPLGNKQWHQVFYKRQFSQNDQAIYSSYFTFKTPSRMRLIYNDEIKNDSTVSEYVFDGIGNYKRTSVLSTEYQNLRLRFVDAVQLSSTELLVPSQRSYGLNLVKIDFSP